MYVFVCDIKCGFMVQTDMCASVRVCEIMYISLCMPMITCVCSLCVSIHFCVYQQACEMYVYMHMCISVFVYSLWYLCLCMQMSHKDMCGAWGGSCVSGCLPEYVCTCEGC